MHTDTVPLALDSVLVERSRALADRLGVTLDALAAQGLTTLLERYAPSALPVLDEPGPRAPVVSGVKRWKRTDLRRRGLEIPTGS